MAPVGIAAALAEAASERGRERDSVKRSEKGMQKEGRSRADGWKAEDGVAVGLCAAVGGGWQPYGDRPSPVSRQPCVSQVPIRSPSRSAFTRLENATPTEIFTYFQ
jgi:hypothetical protein